jgi:hypothetical protein
MGIVRRMMTPDVFQSFRGAGVRALSLAKAAWFNDPLRTAHRYANAILEVAQGSLGIHMVDAFRQQTHANTLLVGRWAACGFPTVTMGHKTAGALMATKIRPDDAVDFVRSPWPAFAIRLPSALLWVDGGKTIREASVLLVTSVDYETVFEGSTPDTKPSPPGVDRWFYNLCAQSPYPYPEWAGPEFDALRGTLFSGISLWGFNLPTNEMAEQNPGEDDEAFTRWETQTGKTTDLDFRSDRMARALILGTCLYLSGDPREREQRLQDEGMSLRTRVSKQRDGDQMPPYTEYELQSSIKLNLHHGIRDYVLHGGSTPSVQTLVAGHWKRVAIGQGRKDRKLVHVKPYWRGDVDAPISVRTR